MSGARLVFAFLFLFLMAGVPLSVSEEILQRLDGRVIRVDEAGRLLVVDFEHPATGERSELEFSVGAEAGFKDFKRLSQLKAGDLVSLDYYDYKPVRKVVYIIHVPLEKTYFTRGEITQALLKMKSGGDDRKDG